MTSTRRYPQDVLASGWQCAGRPTSTDLALEVGMVVEDATVDIWQAVKPTRLGLAGWPEIPRTAEWKHRICAALGLPHRHQADLAAAWRMILDKVRSWDDLEHPLLTVVEQLIDFVTEDHH